ncbi:MAG: diguanylate cyclase [Thermoanaerobaculales bacterium]|jgi:diguanylate cyclase (GGDEF)-like protein|nr:diguanylate cyclase [Thermoanaerobaculales bacterium]
MSTMSLRTRMIVVTVGATLVACGALIAVGYEINRREVEEAVRGRAGAIARRIDLVVGEGSAFQTQESVDRMVASESFLAAVVFSPGREIIAVSPSTADLGPPLTEWTDGPSGLREVRIGGEDAIAVAIELDAGGRAWLAFDRSPYRDAERRMRLAWAVAGSTAVLIAVVAAFIVSTVSRRRIGAVRATIERLGRGELGARCEVRGPIEVVEIARAVNEMAERLSGLFRELGNERSALEQQVSGRTRELEQANRLLMDIANRDALTGLANRRRLEMELERNISFSKRTGQPLAVIMMDLDKFKICNDTAGHLVGDNILRAVASTLRSRVRVTDLVVRWGGDEFCILVPATQPQGAIAAAESLVDAVKEATAAIPLPEPLEAPTASAGVACFPEDGEDPHTLILNADAALYQVKATGRGRVLRYSPGYSKD